MENKTQINPVITKCVICIGAFLFITSCIISYYLRFENTASAIYKANLKDPSEWDVYDEMHKMANTKITADKVWGKIPITNWRINKLMEKVSDKNYDDKDRLLEILNRWKKSDFSYCDEDHNYVWGKLGGTVGRADGINKPYKSILKLIRRVFCVNLIALNLL